ncbi:MAG: hypothetical protein QM705_08870 [Ancrocorticia sp.]
MLISVLVTVLLVGLSVWSGLMVTSAHFGQEAYRDGRLETAEKHYQTNMRVTPDAWEGWEPPFNRGTTRLWLGVDPDAVGVGPSAPDPANLGGDGSHEGSDGESFDGESSGGNDPGGADAGTYHAIRNIGAVDAGVVDLEVALARVPEAKREDGQIVDPDNQPECKARRNLSIGQELQGDVLVAAGDSAAAAKKYELAQETLLPCLESEENQDQSERQEQKEQENSQGDGDADSSNGSGEEGSGNESNGGDSGGQNGGSGGQNDESGPGGGSGGDLNPNAQGKEEQLRERNRRGQGQYDDQQNQNYSGGVNW